MDQRPIGVFDSGIGGITAVSELKKIMPHENIIYFGDTSRVPYGTRSRETIQKYATQDINFLLSKNVKMIVAACGTVSSNPPTQTIESLSVDYTGVLVPAAQAACAATKTNRIGVIATPATIKSGAYGKVIRSMIHTPTIIGKACPLFVPLVENGYTDRHNPVTRLVAEEYLKPLIEEQVDTLILGCTHYPLIEELIGDIMGEDVTLISPGKEAAKYVRALLTNKQLLNTGDQQGSCHYYVSDEVDTFSENASIFLQDDIHGKVEKIQIEEYEQPRFE
jgi:glutamate racemase